ncbi:MAG: hypothetical protein ACYS80_02060 [Planctomycetota bacterium]|jgi:uncharacterized repeat protein (TIGR01451 family)
MARFSIFRMVALVVVILGIGVAAANANGNVLYGVNAADDGLSVGDLTSYTITFIGELDPAADVYMTPVAMAVDPDSGELYVWNNTNPDGVLLTVDRVTGQATPVNTGAAPQGIMQAIAFSSGGTLYGFGIEDSQNGLYTIDTSTGVRTLVAALSPNIPIYAADFDASGILYAVEADAADSEKLFTVDTSTAVMTEVGTLSPDIGIIGSIVFDESGTLIGSGFGGGSGQILFEIDTADATVSNINTVSQAPQGMGFASPFCVTKELVETDDYDGDGAVEVGEPTDFYLTITVANNSTEDTIENVVVTDRLSGALTVLTNIPTTGSVSISTKGKTVKEFLTWNVGSIGPGGSETLELWVSTDLNPAGHQEYTSTGEEVLNSGATAKGKLGGKKVSHTSGSIVIEVVVPGEYGD